MSGRRETPPHVWGALIGVALTVGIAYLLGVFTATDTEFRPAYALEQDGLRRLHDAVEEYARLNRVRPERLKMLVDAGLLDERDLFDPNRDSIPRIGRISHRYESGPDALYIPAVEPGDPGDLILLAQVAVREAGDAFGVIRNDGTHEELSPAELTAELNRTFRYIDGKLRTEE